MIKKSSMLACCGLITLFNTGHATAMNCTRWVSVEGGYSFSIQPNNISTEPMLNVNLPDDYIATGLGNRWLTGAAAGVQFTLPYHMFPSDRVGLAWNYYSSAQVTGQINKWQTTPTYSDSYNLTSNVLWLDNQLDLVQLGKVQPFIDLAIGAAWNKTGNYQETPLPFIPAQAARINSAAFAANTSTDFAWRAGVGGNLGLTEKLKLGVIYRYANLGKASTGASGFYTTVGSINNSVAGNEVLFSLRYDFDTTGDTK